MSDLSGLVDALRPPEGSTLKRRKATVTAVGATTITVLLAGTSVPGISYVAWYAPMVNDVVELIVDGQGIICIGKLTTGSNRVGVTLRRSADQSINDATPTAISWDTETTDTGGFIVVTSDTITFPTGLGGLYMATATATWQSDPGDVRTFMEFAGTAMTNTFTQSNPPRYAPDSDFVDRMLLHVTALFVAAAGETFKVSVYQNAGGGRNVQADLVLYRVGP